MIFLGAVITNAPIFIFHWAVLTISLLSMTKGWGFLFTENRIGQVNG
jgi:hypothetical protein